MVNPGSRLRFNVGDYIAKRGLCNDGVYVLCCVALCCVLKLLSKCKNYHVLSVVIHLLMVQLYPFLKISVIIDLV